MAKNRIVKAFVPEAKRAELIKSYGLIETYDAFVLLDVSPAEAKKISKIAPTEDITDQFQIRSGSVIIDTSKPRVVASGKTRLHPAYKGIKSLDSQPHHHLVQFVGPIKKKWLTAVKKLGGEIRRPYADFTYVVRCDETTLRKIVAQPFVRWAGHLSHRSRMFSKLKPDSGALPRSQFLPSVHRIEFFDAKDMGAGVKVLKGMGVKVLSAPKGAGVATVELTGSAAQQKKLLASISAVHGVAAVSNRNLKRTCNNVAATILGPNAGWLASTGLTGDGETIAVCDTGLDTGRANTIHDDFKGRIRAIRSYPITDDFDSFIKNPGGNDGAADLDSGHGTHVSGSVLGSGAASANLPNAVSRIRGLAHKSRLVFQAVEQRLDWKNSSNELEYGRYLLAGIPNDLTTLFSYAYARGARIHSNSWGGGDPGAYDAQCRQLDEFVWKKKDFCVLVAAGNDGTDQDGDGKINPTSVTSPATAKNCITVGASENLRPEFNSQLYGKWWPQDYPVAPINNDPLANDSDQVAAFSSRGPTKDGRVKPDVVAPGTFILSTRSRMIASNNTAWAAFPPSRMYFHMGGTSMATPLVAGAVGVLREFLKKWVGYTKPSAALVKAALILGARKLPGYSPSSELKDIHQGYGLVALRTIIDPPTPTRVWFVEQSHGVSTGQQQVLDINVASSQVPLRVAMAYTDFPSSRLVNNLNLLLESPSGSIFVGNQGGSGLTPDTTNNTEVIQVAAPQRGKWKLRVVGSNVPQGPQDYAIVFSGDAT